MASPVQYGAFVVDPGGGSGLAWACLEDTGTVPERLAARTEDGYETVRGDWKVQARTIAEKWHAFYRLCLDAGMPAYFVMEDFILTRLKSSEREGLYPVWVAAAVEGYRAGVFDVIGVGDEPSNLTATIWQQPSEAKTYATDERMKRWGLWIPGTAHAHERDARRHLALFVSSRERMRSAQAGV
jgi:hypothetical protein